MKTKKRCPKCGQKLKSCRCQERRKKKIALIILSIVILLIIVSCFANSARLHYYSRPFYAILDSLPDEKIKGDYYHLLNTDQLKLGFITGEMAVPAHSNKKTGIMEISLKAFKTMPQEKLWCVLVHEHGHIYGDKNISISESRRMTPKKNAKLIWDDERNAIKAEAYFAQRQNFLEETHPEIVRAMAELKIDLDTAIAVILFQDLMNSPYQPYQQFKPYFPEIFLNEVPAQHRDKFKFINAK